MIEGRKRRKSASQPDLIPSRPPDLADVDAIKVPVGKIGLLKKATKCACTTKFKY